MNCLKTFEVEKRFIIQNMKAIDHKKLLNLMDIGNFLSKIPPKKMMLHVTTWGKIFTTQVFLRGYSQYIKNYESVAKIKYVQKYLN